MWSVEPMVRAVFCWVKSPILLVSPSRTSAISPGAAIAYLVAGNPLSLRQPGTRSAPK